MSKLMSAGMCMICAKPIYNQQSTLPKWNGKCYETVHAECTKQKLNVFASGGKHPGAKYRPSV